MMRLSRQVAAALAPNARRRVRAVADAVLAPVGSIARAKHPTDLVAISFDDGPDPLVTPRLIEYLGSEDVKATFFLLTDRAAAHPEIVRAMVREGHEIGLHSDNHDRLAKLKASDVRERLRRARGILEDITGVPVTYFRAPYGAQSIGTVRVAQALGLEVCVWGPTAYDWEEQPAEQAAGRALESTRGGDIVLLHDGLYLPAGEQMPTFDRVEMVRILIQGLRSKGLRPTTLGHLVTAAGAHKSAWFRP